MVENWGRNCENLFVHRSTVDDALHGCTVCSYRILVNPPTQLHGLALKPGCRTNQRPESCRRLAREHLKENYYIQEKSFIADLISLQEQTSILVVGDGNLSFSYSIASQLKNCNITGSTLFSEQDLYEKYPDASDNVSKLKIINAGVLFGIDATKLSSYASLSSRKFDVIIFNFPCIEVNPGQDAQAEEISSNQELIRNFLKSSSEILNPSGIILITHKSKEPFCWWGLETLCLEVSNLKFQLKVVFDKSSFPEYKPRKVSYLKGADSTKNSFPIFDAEMFVFTHSTFDFFNENNAKFEKDLASEDLFTLDLLKNTPFLKVTSDRLVQIVHLLQFPQPKYVKNVKSSVADGIKERYKRKSRNKNLSRPNKK